MPILGQPHVLHYLAEGLRAGRLSPSLLFVGQDGVGKRSVALELAQCFACEAPGASASGLPRCGSCPACLRVAAKSHADVLVLDRELQATLLREKTESQTAIKIEAVRHADKFLSLRAMESRRRVVIIDEAQRMTVDAANAMLKTLEEPPNNAQIVLLATDEHSLPTTIRSRCAVLYFRLIPTRDVANWLEKEKGLDPMVAAEVADRAAGSMSRAAAIADEESSAVDLSAYALDEFFEEVAEARWRKDARRQAEGVIVKLIESAQRKLEQGDLSQRRGIEAMLRARRRLDHHVPPKLVLETLYLALQSPTGEAQRT